MLSAATRGGAKLLTRQTGAAVAGARREFGSSGASCAPIQTVTVVGSGLMGSGIAQVGQQHVVRTRSAGAGHVVCPSTVWRLFQLLILAHVENTSIVVSCSVHVALRCNRCLFLWSGKLGLALPTLSHTQTYIQCWGKEGLVWVQD